MSDIEFGRIIIPIGLFPEKHELETANFFAKAGKDIEFIPLSYTKGMRTPDIQMDGVLWEIKSPQGNSRRTIEKNYKKAEQQSENVIFDLHRIAAVNEKQTIEQIKKEFVRRRKRIKRILIITKNKTLIDLRR